MTAQSSSASHGRIAELDGLRGAAVLFVFVHHYFTGILPAGMPYAAHIARQVVAPFFTSGVDLFFVISGFIVGGIVMDNVKERWFFRSFYIRRATRILPLYFGMYFIFLTATAINHAYPGPLGIWLVKDNMPLWSYAVFMQNYFMAFANEPGGRLFGMAWSVATEEHFYVLFPVTLWLLGLRRMTIVCLTLLVFCTIIRFAAAAKFGFYAGYMPFPARADSIAYGVLVAMTVRARPNWFASRTVIRSVLAFTLIGGMVLVADELNLISISYYRYSLLGQFYGGIMILGVTQQGRVAAILRNRTLLFFGYISYALYMVHQTINGLMYGFVHESAPRMHSLQDLALTCVSVLAAVLAAYLSTTYFEMPIRRWGYRITRNEPLTIWTPAGLSTAGKQSETKILSPAA